MLELLKISKKFGEVQVFNDLSLSFKSDSRILLTGENGSGKSTLLHLIGGSLLPCSGKVHFTGLTKPKISMAMANAESFIPELSGSENLILFSSFYGLSRGDAKTRIKSFSKIQAFEFLNKSFLTFSSGMKQKLNLLRSLMIQPDVLLLDEPLDNLDQESIETFQSLISQFTGLLIIASHRKEDWIQLSLDELNLKSVVS